MAKFVASNDGRQLHAVGMVLYMSYRFELQVRDSKLVADREARSARGQTAHLEQELSFYQAQSASAMVTVLPEAFASECMPQCTGGGLSMAVSCALFHN